MRKWLCLAALLLAPWLAKAAPATPYDADLMLYYPRLTQAQQAVFDLAYAAAWQGEDRAELPAGTSYADACAAMDALMLDCPELCALSGAYSVTYYRHKPQEAVSIELKYIMPVERQRRLLSAAQEMADAAAGDEFIREWYLHDLLCQRVTYDAEGSFPHTAWGALTEGRAVCDGYARAMTLLLRLAGIESGLARGTVLESGASHAWNLVKIDGAYAWLDVTNDDQAAMTTYFFFNLTDEWLLRSYTLESEGLPACDDESVNWHVQNWRYVTDAKEMQKHIFNNFRNMKAFGSRFCLRFERQADYLSLRNGVSQWAIQYNKLGEYPIQGQLRVLYNDAQQCAIVLFDE